MSPLTTCDRNVDSKWSVPPSIRWRRGRIGYRPGGGGRCPPPPECLQWFSRTVTSALEAARGALDRLEVVALHRVDGEHLVRGVAELVEGDRATCTLEVRRLDVRHHGLAGVLAPGAALHGLGQRGDDDVGGVVGEGAVGSERLGVVRR